MAALCLVLGVGLGALLMQRTIGPVADAASPEAILALEDPLTRSVRWGALLEASAPDALPELRDALAAAPIELGDPEVVSLAMWWARFAPEEALAWTGSEWRAQSRLVVGAVFRVWAHGAPHEAFARVDEVPEFHRDAALDAVIAGWHESGQPGLVEHVETLPGSELRQRVGESLARRLVLALGTDGALAWVRSLTSPGLRETMARRVASAASEQGDSAAIAAWAEPFVTSGDARPSGYPRRIGTRWILRDPEAALAWLASLPAGTDRDDGVTESYRDWSRYAPGAALHWIQNAELERWSEPAFAIHARGLSRESPQQALELAARFSDADLRDRTITVIARAWAARAPEEANAWLAQTDLPEVVRERVKIGLRAGG